MATVHREPNQVKWIGVRPGHNGDEVAANGLAQNNTAIVYTVPADKIFCFTDFVFSADSTANDGLASFAVYTAVPAVDYTIVDFSVRLRHQEIFGHQFGIPLELSAGYSIRLTSGIATCYAKLFVHGFVIDA